nr:MAG TPA: hypothetical protein [Bacteriophage sp.]
MFPSLSTDFVRPNDFSNLSAKVVCKRSYSA